MNYVRDLVCDGRHADALDVLDTMQDQSGGMAITYRGFATRKSGEMASGMAFYKPLLP